MGVSGTKEWAANNVNCIKGCEHDCRYCYAKAMAVKFGRKTSEDWHREEIRKDQVSKHWPFLNGTTMFPTTHDITRRNVGVCEEVIIHLLTAGNTLLIVSKPHPEVIGRLCQTLREWVDKIQFRFTIGSRRNSVLSYWEPHAPTYEERKSSLTIAHKAGYETSVSVEPMLDSPDIEGLVGEVEPVTTGSIWLGKMNSIGSRVSVGNASDRERIAAIRSGQTDEKIRSIHAKLRTNTKIKWKESIKEVVGIQLAQRPGMDM